MWHDFTNRPTPHAKKRTKDAPLFLQTQIHRAQHYIGKNHTYSPSRTISTNLKTAIDIWIFAWENVTWFQGSGIYLCNDLLILTQGSVKITWQGSLQSPNNSVVYIYIYIYTYNPQLHPLNNKTWGPNSFHCSTSTKVCKLHRFLLGRFAGDKEDRGPVATQLRQHFDLSSSASPVEIHRRLPENVPVAGLSCFFCGGEIPGSFYWKRKSGWK